MPLPYLGIAEEAKDGLAKSGRHMHCPPIAADDLLACSQSREKLRQRMSRKRDDWESPELIQDQMRFGIITRVRWVIRLARRPKQDECEIRLPFVQLTQELNKSLGGPTLLWFSCTDVHADQNSLRRQRCHDQIAGGRHVTRIDEHGGFRWGAVDTEEWRDAKYFFHLVQRPR